MSSNTACLFFIMIYTDDIYNDERPFQLHWLKHVHLKPYLGIFCSQRDP